MSKYVVVKTGGKQYLAKENDILTVDFIDVEVKAKVELVTLAKFDTESGEIELGTPELKSKTNAEVVEILRGDKIRVARFKAKSRYRRVRGFRAELVKLKIGKI